MSIIAPLPYNINNGDPIDATPVMANFNQILNNVNSNAANLSALNTFTQPQNGVAAILPAQFTTYGQVLGLFAALVPTGTILDYAASAAPSGAAWLLCDGSAVSRTTYAALFAAIGIIWGAGDGTSTFNLPDFRRAASIGSGGSGSFGTTTGSAGGSETRAMTLAELVTHAHTVNDPTHAHSVNDPSHVHGVNDPSHAHAVSDPGHAHSYTATVSGIATYATGFPFQGYGPVGAATAGSGTGIGIFGAVTGIFLSAAVTGIGIFGAATGITVANTGSGGAMNMMQPSRVVTKIIRTGN